MKLIEQYQRSSCNVSTPAWIHTECYFYFCLSDSRSPWSVVGHRCFGCSLWHADDRKISSTFLHLTLLSKSLTCAWTLPARSRFSCLRVNSVLAVVERHVFCTVFPGWTHFLFIHTSVSFLPEHFCSLTLLNRWCQMEYTINIKERVDIYHRDSIVDNAHGRKCVIQALSFILIYAKMTACNTRAQCPMSEVWMLFYVCFLLMWHRNCSVFGVFVVILDFMVASKLRPGAWFIKMYDHVWIVSKSTYRWITD